MSDGKKVDGFEACWPAKRQRSVRPKGGGGASRARRSARGRSDGSASSASSGGISEADKARLTRVVRGAPEVMVKVTRPSKKDKDGQEIVVTPRTERVRVANHIDYLSRNGEIDLETSDGHVLSGKSATGVLTAEWVLKHYEARQTGYATHRTRMTTSLVFSMPAEVCVNAECVKDAVRSLAEDEFGGRHDYVMALHTDKDHPHVHRTFSEIPLASARGISEKVR